MTTTQDVGDKWARTITEAFLAWQREVEIEGRKNIPATKFDPSPFIEAAFLEGGEAQLEEIGKLVGMGVSFDLKSPEAIAWLEKFCGDEIKYIDAGTKAGIRETILRGFQEGLSPNEQIKIIKQNVGLIPQHVQAVRNFEAGLEKLDMDESARKLAVDRYRNKLLRWRASTIALSEGHRAANEGYREANRGAVKRGILSPDDWEREWLVTPDERLCPLCRPMSGKRAELPNGQFEGGGDGPTLHPRCRCTEILVKRAAPRKQNVVDYTTTPEKISQLSKDSHDLWEHMNDDERAAMHGYSGGVYMIMNDMLFDPDKYFADTPRARANRRRPDFEKAINYIKDLSTALGRSRVSDDVTAYRGIADWTWEIMEKDMPEAIKPGTILQYKGFMSTSISEKQARKFAQVTVEGSKPTVLELQIDRGSNGMFIKSFSQMPHEEELLLNRDTAFEVVDFIETEKERRLIWKTATIS